MYLSEKVREGGSSVFGTDCSEVERVGSKERTHRTPRISVLVLCEEDKDLACLPQLRARDDEDVQPLGYEEH